MHTLQMTDVKMCSVVNDHLSLHYMLAITVS